MDFVYTDKEQTVNALEVDFSGGVNFTIPGRGVRKLSMYVTWANYTGVTVKLQASIDGTNFADVNGWKWTTAGTPLASGDVLSGELGPYDTMRVNVVGTLSAGVDTLKVWIKQGAIPSGS